MTILAVSIGGAIGALLRYGFTKWSTNLTLFGVSIGTLGVNVVGSFLIGLLYAKIGESPLSAHLKLFLFTGLLGGFTTFSAYSIEAVSLFQSGQTNLAFMTILLHNVLGISMAFAGYMITK
ncbi:fluoride efflux transporter CrcB [Candidatus Marinamargulisbacteria bacterium SCGC AG-439-L15]|nr:fluoride efflux transporter CrcB [Candidatus Marinamargulisbacteria bacterium SCGC AG-439-L15]